MQSNLPHQVIDAGRIGNRGPAGDAVHVISFFQQKLCQIGPVLPGDTGNQCYFTHDAFVTPFALCFYMDFSFLYPAKPAADLFIF